MEVRAGLSDFMRETGFGGCPLTDTCKKKIVTEPFQLIVQSLKGKVSLSLNAWTSSNCYAFLAIVAHYVRNDGQYGMSHLQF